MVANMPSRYLYSSLLYIVQPFIWLKLGYRSLKAKSYRHRVSERYGFGPTLKQGGIWLHSVSVGETIASIPLVKALQAAYPQLPITITTMTPTGSEQVQKSFGESVQHCYLPYDLPCAMRRLINNINPKIAIVMETELWPNMIHQLNRRNIPVMLANGRLSARSAKGYGKVKSLVSPMLNEMSLIAAQYQADGDRYIELGLTREKLQVCGSVKFDINVSDTQRQQANELKHQWAADKPVWIAASTHAGEDEILLAAHKQLLQTVPNALLILVPRHPERFDEVAKLVANNQFRFLRKSHNEAVTADCQVIIGDTMGELMTLFGIADVAFIGGSLVERGGHNPLEPAAYGLPLIMGPHTFNFSSICTMLEDASALTTVSDEHALEEQLRIFFKDKEKASIKGKKALAVLQLNQGSLAKHLALIDQLLGNRHDN